MCNYVLVIRLAKTRPVLILELMALSRPIAAKIVRFVFFSVYCDKAKEELKPALAHVDGNQTEGIHSLDVHTCLV